MRNILNKLIPLAIVISIVSLTAILTTSKQTPSKPEGISFSIGTLSASCLFEPKDLDVRTVNRTLEIIVPMIAETPCYHVVGDVKVADNDIEVFLSMVPSQNYCTQCVGEITGKVVIQNLEKGVYNLRLISPSASGITTVTIE